MLGLVHFSACTYRNGVHTLAENMDLTPLRQDCGDRRPMVR
jgi:hypothetical protein